MTRPTPALIFGSTALVIALLLGLVTSPSFAPAAVQAAAPRVTRAEAGAPEVFYPAAPAGEAGRPTEAGPAEAASEPAGGPAAAPPAVEPPVVEPVFPELSAAEAGQDLDAFIATVADGTQRPVGVFAPGRFGFPVVRQPEGDGLWVSEAAREVTLFGAPLEHGVTALLAHNNLAGQAFGALPDGQTLVLVYGDGRTESYTVTGQAGFQSVEPRNTASDFIELETGARLTSGQVFERFYTGAHRLVLQTCIERGGDYYWGRLFLLAEPLR